MGSAARGDDQPPHAPRFQFLLGALVALGLAAVAIVVAVAASGPSRERAGGPRWSIWQPNGKSPVADQIAQHVGREYRLASGHQLVFVTGGAPEVAQLPVTFVFQQAVSQGGDYVPIDGKGAMYRFCGFGPKCSITEGKPSTRRGLLLRREALELALYTFRYTDVDNVVVLFPPALAKNPSKTPDPNLAVYLRRQDVDSELAQPLDATLARKAAQAGDREALARRRVRRPRDEAAPVPVHAEPGQSGRAGIPGPSPARLAGCGISARRPV